MRDSRKIVYLLWTVIAVLVVGGAVGGFLLAHKVDQLTTENAELSGNNESLRNQLLQAKATPPPSESPSPSGSPAPTASPSPTPTATPSPTKTPDSR